MNPEKSSEHGRARTSRRGGRPRSDQAGEVERRILDAASNLFLKAGFDATSCDRVAVLAKAGKASLYVRYPNKERLFAAVVEDKVARSLAPSNQIAWSRPLRERLRAAGEALLIHVLQPDSIAFMRVVYTTAHRMPELAMATIGAARENGVSTIAKAIVGDPEASPADLEAAKPVASKFLDITFVPHQMRALIGEPPDQLALDAAAKVDEAIELLECAGWLRRWS